MIMEKMCKESSPFCEPFLHSSFDSISSVQQCQEESEKRKGIYRADSGAEIMTLTELISFRLPLDFT